MSFSFKYKPEKLNSGAILHRPLIPLTLEGKEKIDVFAILDSGSDMTIIPREIAEKGHESYIFEIPVLIPDKDNLAVIIGRAGFFNQFKITFIESEKRIEFKKIDS